MHKMILGDHQAVFRTGMAKILPMEGNLCIIAQCSDYPGLYRAVSDFHGSIVIVASSMRMDLEELIVLARLASSRVILIAENGSPPSTVLAELQGMIHRDVSSAELIDCVRKVTHGERSIHPVQRWTHSVQPNCELLQEDLVGARVRDRLTPKEMKIVALIVQGCKNKEIGLRLNTSEQTIKNYLRNVFDKTGVSDRLELALFTIHHRTLLEAAKAVGNLREFNVSSSGENPIGQSSFVDSERGSGAAAAQY
jgi:DNA-binding NarL/FixJ family response regulator